MRALLSFLAGLTAAAAATAAAPPAVAAYLRTEYQIDPAIVAIAAPRFSWLLPTTPGARGVVQSAYRIVVTSVTGGGAAVWDSGVVTSASTAQVAYAGPALAVDSVYSWTVTWTDGAGASAPASAPAFFGTAPGDDAAWDAAGSQWVGCTGAGGMANANMLRVDFPATPPSAGATVTQARLYASGLGWFLPFMNGAPLSKAALDPAFTSLRSRVLYNAYDVTSLVDTSARGNTFAALLGHGWPDVFAPWGDNTGVGEPPWNGTGSSSVTARSELRARALAAMTQEEMEQLIAKGYGHGHTGYERRLRAWLSIRWSDGTTSTALVSSAAGMGGEEEAAAPSGWQCGTGPLLYDDLYGGCTWDARAETPGWTAQGFNYSTGQWADAVRIAAPGGTMSPALHPPVVVVGELAPCAMWESSPGAYVFDFCQNFAGTTRLTLAGPTQAGVTVTMRHAEAVMHPPYGDKDGTLYYGNLRSAEATDVYTTRGSDVGEEFVPVFTWHGFRYCEVSGLPFVPELTGTITGLNLRSNVAAAGSLSFPASANTMNQLQHAIFWGQASNILGNPSDCPQRDERLGWTGDSALTSEESALNFDMAAFLTNWAQTVDDALNNAVDHTWVAGGLPETIPDVTGGYNADASWSSVWPTTLHTLWKSYGDARVVQTHWADLMLYVNATVTGMKGGDISGIFHTWGDWCPPGSGPGEDQGPKPDPAYSAGATFLGDLANVIEMAQALGAPDTARLLALQASLTAQFVAAWGHGGAWFGSSPTDGAQTAQAHALGVGAVPAADVPAVAAYLMADIAAHDAHLSVGIIGMKHLARALTATGNAYTAVNISLQTDYPSFGWTFNHPDEPATTLWELWNGPSEGPGMNSRNHIMQGAIGAWLYSDVAGIAQQPGSAGYGSLLIWPRATTHERLPNAAGSYASIRGTVTVEWRAANGSFSLAATVPAGVVAEVRLPFPPGAPAAALVASEGPVPATCVAGAPENAPVTLTCPPGGVVTAVTFASFGTPSGSCAAGFAAGTCNAANSTAILAAACVGRASCTINVSTTLFGDPCYETVKVLDAQLACSSNATNVFFQNGAYVPGVPGITGASVNANASALAVTIGSGAYEFTLSGW